MRQMIGVFVTMLLVATQTATGNEMLLAAARDGDTSTLRSLLDKDAGDINEARADGSTALLWAVYADDEEAVNLLISKGADVNAATDYHSVTPLSVACGNDNSSVVIELLEAGADPNIARVTGETPLMTCANTGAAAGAEALLEHGADVNASEHKQGQTALMWAAAEKHPRVVQALVEHGADVNARSKLLPEPEPYILEMQRSESVWPKTYPAQVRFPEVSGGFTALMFAAQSGDVESARILLEAGADVNFEHPELGGALVIAIASDHEDLARFLLENGADPDTADAWGNTALHYALHRGLLILNSWKPADSESMGWERHNMPQLVEALLDYGANPNARIKHTFPFIDNEFLVRGSDDPPQISPVGATPLLLAAVSGDTESMRILEEGSDPTAKTIGGGTLFMLAAGGGVERGAREGGQKAIEAAKLALEMGGGSVHDRLTDVAWGGPARGETDGRTPLHFATQLGWKEMIKFLVENGAEIDAKDRYGMTPLMHALGDPEGRYYRQVGDGNYDLRMRRPGPTPGTGAREDIAELLLELGAEPFTGEYRDSSGL